MLLIADAASAAPFHAAIGAIGARLLQRVGWADVAALLPRLGGRPLFAIEARDVNAAMLDAVLPILADHLVAEEGTAVLALGTAQIDLVARHLLGERIELLCDPSPAQRVAALTEACRRMPPTLQEGLSDTVRSDREPFLHVGRESDEERLRRLTDGMARISRFAADFVHNQPVAGTAEVGDRRRAFMTLSPRASEAMHAYMIALRKIEAAG
jgi:hypothetical protein